MAKKKKMRYTSKGWIVLLFLVTKSCDSSVTPWTAARQAPLSMGFSRQEHWSGLPFLYTGDLPHLGIGPMSPALAGGFFTTDPLGKPKGWMQTNKREKEVKWNRTTINCEQCNERKSQGVKKEMGGVGGSNYGRCLEKTHLKERQNAKKNVIGSRGHMC